MRHSNKVIYRRAGGDSQTQSSIPHARTAMCAPEPSFLRACLLLCLVAGTNQLSITQFEVPKLVEVGSEVELKCNYYLHGNLTDKGLFVKWWWTPPNGGPDDRVQLYQRGPDHLQRSLQHKIDIHLKENDTILLTNVQPIASGEYECEVSAVDEDRRHQQLIVYSQGSGPLLNVTEVPDGPDEDEEVDILVECVSEDAAPRAHLSITVDGNGKYREYVNATDVVIGPDSNGYYNVSSSWTVSKKEVEGGEIQCELYYEDKDVVHAPFIVKYKHQTKGPVVLESSEETDDYDVYAAAAVDPLPTSPNEAQQSQVSALLFSSMMVARGCFALFVGWDLFM